MKLKSSLILIVAALLVLGCATVRQSASVVNDSQAMAEQTLVSGIQYYLEDIYDYDILFMIQPMIKQTLVSEIQYYLEDIYDYDSVSFMAENETPFFLTEPVPNQTLVSGIQYYLEDIYDYD